MRKTLLFALLVILQTFLIAQTELSGVINQYADVTDIDYCAATLTVSDASGFLANTDVIVIQMQGAVINTSDNAEFGDLQDLRSAGLLERARIRAVNGNIISLENTLLNTYNLDGSVQMVSLPVYENATVTDSIVAAPWNGSTGGMLALEVTNVLTLNGNISAHGRGFRGGLADISQSNNCTFLIAQNDYYYNLGNWRGAAKGEGIAKFTTEREAGRGAQSNGGGGGNDHNSGGGGGANIAAGGKGGNNEEPSALGCDGRFPGVGGKALPDLASRIFMGGGGGAGHENNDQATNGGNGGGIIILIASAINGNNRTIDVRGMSVTEDTNGDGGGGGGGGGTILMDVVDIQSPFLVDVSGGSGGSVDNGNVARCHGTGGGGGGGRILMPLGLPINFIVSGGDAGRTYNSGSSSCPDGNNGALPGEDGFFADVVSIPRSTEISGETFIVSQPEIVDVCENQSVEIALDIIGSDLQYQWQINQAGNFQNLNDNSVYAGSRTPVLSINRVTTEMTNYSFRLVISSNCYPSVTSLPVRLTFATPPAANFTSEVNGFNVLFTNNSANADTYYWDFGDGSTSSDVNPQHTYANDGSYEVTLRAIGACDTVIFSQTIEIISSPTAGFSADMISGCAPFAVSFENTSSASAISFSWIFPGASPTSSTQRNPTVTYIAPGRYSVTLIASNAVGSDTLQLVDFIEVLPLPIPNFTFAINEFNVVFVNNAVDSASYLWNFGDGNTSTQTNPTHTYTSSGNYVVTLTATNVCGSQTVTKNVTVGTAPVVLFTQDRQNGCVPHLVKFRDESTGTYDSRIWSFPGGNPATSTDANPTVRYDAPGLYDVTLTINGALGSSTLTQEGYITVLEQPTPAFDLTVNGMTVQFLNASTGATSLLWNFGDGATSTETNPTHTYMNAGIYTITLNASNAYCGRSTTRTVAVGVTDVEDLRQNGIMIFPNPMQEVLYINAETFGQRLDYQLLNPRGQLLHKGSFRQYLEMDLSAFAKGLYLLQLRTATHVWIVRIVKS